MGNTADFTRGEPAPIPVEGPSMHDLAVSDINLMLASSGEIPPAEYAAITGVIGEIMDRRAFGLEKYGTILQAGNGRNPVRDALDEALDLIVYVRQMLIEVKVLHKTNIESMYRNAIEFAIALKYLLMMSEKMDDNGSVATEADSPDLERGQHRAVPEVPGEEEGQLRHN